MLRFLRNSTKPISKFSRSYFDSQKQFKILVGTQTGTAMGFAHNLADAAAERGLSNMEIIDLEEYNPIELSKEEQLILIMACYGAGEPTDNARNFYNELMKKEGKTFANLNYTVFGLGSSKTHQHNYNIVAKKVDTKMSQLGAQRAYDLGLGDDSACIEVDFQKWQEGLLDKILNNSQSGISENNQGKKEGEKDSQKTNESKTSGETTLSVSGSCPAEPPFTVVLSSHLSESAKKEPREKAKILKQGGFYKSNTLIFPVLSNVSLNPQYIDSMLEMRLGFPSLFPEQTREHLKDQIYETGDHIGVYPENDPKIVESLSQRLNYNLNDLVKFDLKIGGRKPPFPSGVTIKDVLSSCLEIQSMPKPSGISVMASFARNSQDKTRLESISRNPEVYKEQIWKANRHFVDLMEEFNSVELPFSSLLQVVPVMQPRYYSISSSSIEYPKEVHMTYRWVRYYNSVIKAERQGVATRYLKSFDLRSQEGLKEVYGFLRSSSFRQPLDPLDPVVMIAGGSGIAPLKAFLQERLYNVKTKGTKYGAGILLFGVRSPDDLVYSSLIKECLDTKAMTSCYISYSSPSPVNTPSYTPRFVAQDVKEHSQEIWKAVSEGGYVYLCGGASAFAQTCQTALRQVFQTHGRLDAQGADDYLLSLIRQKRFMEDLSD